MFSERLQKMRDVLALDNDQGSTPAFRV